ncbi:MAG: Outer rane receptor protein [Myxococcaceae bacterium]|nr:Outer rane receptor protein [Myxococcaceae bacterium]
MRRTLIALGALAAVSAPRLARAEQDPDPACLAQARTRNDVQACLDAVGPPKEVMVRAKPPPRSASDWEVDSASLKAAPHESGADVLDLVPGVFVSDRGLPGRAPHLSLRGFDGTSGQDVEVYAGNIPMNQISHLRAPGYADMRLIMPEVIRAVRVSHGPYDPRQGDFGVAGSLHMDLGLDKPGFWAKGGAGSFGARRVFLAFAPEGENDALSETFAAFETDATDGPGGTRRGERSSFVGQVGGNNRDDMLFHATVALGSARFDFPGYAAQSSIERGAYAYGRTQPAGRDRTSQALVGADILWRVGEGTLGLGAFAGKTRTSFHQNLTGFVLDPLAGLAPTSSDDGEQVNDATTAGLTMLYRHAVEITSRRDSIELGTYARVDTVDQTDTRLNDDLTKKAALVDATVDAANVAAYADASLFPWRRVVIRGGTRLDSLSYSVKDRTSNAGLERTAQGFHLGNKATVDVAVGGGAHLVGSYGEGFRSPQARELAEGDRVPFATVRSVEGGVSMKMAKVLRASAVGFSSWLSHDRVFDATARANVEAPSSVRVGTSGSLALHAGAFGTSVSATYTRAQFTGADANFRNGEAVPYAPAFVVRDDAYVTARLGSLAGRRVTGRVGIGLEGVAGRPLPGGRDGKNLAYVDALASVGWRELELSVNGTNLLGLRYYDSQYVYVSNFEKRPTLPPPSAQVLVAPPTAIFVTLQIHIRGLLGDSSTQDRNTCLDRATTDRQREDCYER